MDFKSALKHSLNSHVLGGGLGVWVAMEYYKVPRDKQWKILVAHLAGHVTANLYDQRNQHNYEPPIEKGEVVGSVLYNSDYGQCRCGE